MLKQAIAIAALSLAATGAQAASYVFSLSGLEESPPNASPATGSGTIDVTGNLFTIDFSFSGLLANPTGAHIHCCAPPGVNAGVVINFFPFPATTSGSFMQVYDLDVAATYNASFVVASGGTVPMAKARLLAELENGNTYVNVHTTDFPGGEIRGQVRAAVAGGVPEPASWAMLIVGFGLVGSLARRKAALAA